MIRIEYEQIEDIEKSKQLKYALKHQQKRWDRPVRRGLIHLGNAIWSKYRFMGLLPSKSFRVLSRGDEVEYYWWIEEDIPPYGRNQCATYIVSLKLDKDLNPLLIVRSKERIHVVNHPDEESLQQAIDQVSQEAPLVTLGHMGPAWD